MTGFEAKQAEGKMEKQEIEFRAGQKVRTVFGEIRTVVCQRDCQVFVREESNGWYHPTKVWPVR